MTRLPAPSYVDRGLAAKLRKQAARAREATAERDRLICAMRAEGVPLRSIAGVAGLSHTAVARIVERAN